MKTVLQILLLVGIAASMSGCMLAAVALSNSQPIDGQKSALHGDRGSY